MTTTPAPQPASQPGAQPAAPLAGARRGLSRPRLLVSALVVLVMLAGGALVGRNLRPATPRLPTAYPVLPASSATARDGSVTPVTAQAAAPAGYAVLPADYPASSAAPPAPGVAVGAGLAVGSGRPVANPSGAPDLSADPEAAIAGTPPAAAAAGEAPDLPDAVALARLTERYDALASASGARPTPSASAGATPAAPSSAPAPTATDGGLLPGIPTDLSRVPIRAFSDPCALDASSAACGRGISAIVLGIRQMPAFQTLWVGEIRRTDLYAGECARQFPTAPIDWANDTIFAAVVNQPVVARVDLQLRTPGVMGSVSRISHLGRLISSESAIPSADLAAVWVDAFERGAQTPAIPLCLKVSKAEMETNRDGCLGEFNYSKWQDCAADFTMSVQTGCGSASTDFLCEGLGDVLGGATIPRVTQGPFRFTYSYDPQWAIWDPQFGGGGKTTEASLRRPVRLTPVDALNLEVAIPTFAMTLGEPRPVPGSANGDLREGRLRVTGNQMVAAAGYAPGTDCRTVDPSIVSTTLPVTRQGARTRYWTPDAAVPASREGVVNLTMPRLAAGEAVDICVFWYELPTRSYDNVVVTAIERHTVVPPARAATELAFVGVGRGGDAPSTPAGSIEAELARWTFQVIGDRRLSAACGFPTGNAPEPVILHPVGDPGFLCRLDSSEFLFEPRDIELYAGDVANYQPEGRTRIRIDNRGCTPTDCGPERRSRIELTDGRWIDLAVRKVPFATAPMLPGGRIAADWSADQWRIDPSGFAGVAPRLRTPVRQSVPALDTFGMRVVPTPGNPTNSLDLVWQADREVSLEVNAQALPAAFLAPDCTSTVISSTPVASSGTTTMSGLCSNTEYGFRVVATDATTGAQQTYTWLTGGARVDLSGIHFNLIGRTKPRPVPADFLAGWSVNVAESPQGSPAQSAEAAGLIPTSGSLAALTVRIGEHTLVSRTNPTSGCTSTAAGTPLAQGFDGGQSLGQLRVSISYTLTAPGPGVCSGPVGTVSFAIAQDIVWEGRAEQTFRLSAPDGRSVTLTLRPAGRD